MSYLDRLRSAEYIAPSGAAFTLYFDSLGRSGGKKAAVHEFPQQDAPFVQDLGLTAQKVPLTCYFTGDDYDQTADAFWAALGERGPGTLRHPRFGDLSVLATSYSQQEGFVEGMGRAEFTVDFVVVPERAAFPASAVSLEATVAEVSEAAAAATGEAIAADFAPTTARDKVEAQEAILASVEETASWGQEIVAASAELATAFDKAVRDLENQIDELMDDPSGLATAYIRVCRLPAAGTGSILAKVSGYAGLIESALAFIPEAEPAEAMKAMILSGLTTGMIDATLIGTIKSRQEAVLIADTLTDTYRAALAGLESVDADVGVIEALADGSSGAARALLARSFTLATERRVVLATERTPLDLVAEFYGGIDRLDEFIETNGLGGDALFLIPAGREVVYYG